MDGYYFKSLRQLVELITEVLNFHDKEIKPIFDKFEVVTNEVLLDPSLIGRIERYRIGHITHIRGIDLK